MPEGEWFLTWASLAPDMLSWLCRSRPSGCLCTCCRSPPTAATLSLPALSLPTSASALTRRSSLTPWKLSTGEMPCTQACLPCLSACMQCIFRACLQRCYCALMHWGSTSFTVGDALITEELVNSALQASITGSIYVTSEVCTPVVLKSGV